MFVNFNLNLQNNIVNEKVFTIRSLSMQTLRGHFAASFAFSLMIFAIMFAPEILLAYVAGNTVVSALLNIYSVFVTGPLYLSMAYYFTQRFRMLGTEKSLRISLEHVWNAVLMYLRISLTVYIASLLFVIPGIFMMLRYSQAFYILADDPEKSVTQCLIESGFLMRGNKIKYLLLELAFLPDLLAAFLITSFVCGSFINIPETADTIEEISAAVYAIPFGQYAAIGAMIIVMLAFIATMKVSAKACFRDLASGKLAVRTDLHMPDEYIDPDRESFADKIINDPDITIIDDDSRDNGENL